MPVERWRPATLPSARYTALSSDPTMTRPISGAARRASIGTCTNTVSLPPANSSVRKASPESMSAYAWMDSHCVSAFAFE